MEEIRPSPPRCVRVIQIKGDSPSAVLHQPNPFAVCSARTNSETPVSRPCCTEVSVTIGNLVILPEAQSRNTNSGQRTKQKWAKARSLQG
jgi:hypothetical protein